MRTYTQSDPKSEYLRQTATLNPRPESVSDALFQVHPFFDPRDLLQVKYEMLHRVFKDGQAVGATAAAFGFSRVSFSQLRKRFNTDGLFGLLPQIKGPHQAYKLSASVLVFIEDILRAEPELRTRDLPARVKERFGIAVHLRSIERALTSQRKKDRPATNHHSHSLSQWSGLRLRVCSDTNSCDARRWVLVRFPVPWLWKWHSLSGKDLWRGWQPTGAGHWMPTRTLFGSPPQSTQRITWFWRWQIWC